MANEQRLIDADALLRNSDVFTVHTKEYGSIEVIPVEQIGDAPTVDAVPVVHGEWLEEDKNGISIKGHMVCSVCNVMIPKTDNNHYCLPVLCYCPACGSQMDGGNENG